MTCSMAHCTSVPSKLFHRNCPRRLSAEIAANRDALRIRRVTELTAVFSAAVVRQSSDARAARRDEDLQRRV